MNKVMLAIGLLITGLAIPQSGHAVDKKCYKRGEKIAVYGAVDVTHFFHYGNGMHVAAKTIATFDRICVVDYDGKKKLFNSLQLFPSDGTKSLTDGMLVNLEGTYRGFGDTAWYTNFPVLEDVKVTKIHETDPNEVK